MKYEFIGWCNEEGHDKIWGVILLREGDNQNTYASFWGRRGKKLQTKVFEEYSWDVGKVINKKAERYRKIDENRLGTVYPEFEEDLRKTAVWAILRA
jgi:hypothetical protein